MLIGRAAEGQAIAQVVSAARVGRSGALVLTGEAGMGKTSLLAHAIDLAAGMQVLQATGSEPEADVAFAGLHQLLHPVLGALQQLPGPQAQALAVALALREGSGGGRFAVGAAVLTLLSRIAESSPLLVVVDDAHALDRSSAEALAFVARRLVADRIGVLVASRPDPGAPLLTAGLPHRHLEGLSPDEVAALLARHGGAAVAPELAARLHRATGGNPLAVAELAGDAAQLDRLSPQAPLPVPEAVLERFSRRIADLGARTRAALLLAAVADGDLGVIARAAPAMGVQTADLGPAEGAGLVTLLPGRVAFRHPMVRASAYAAVPPATRRRAHAAVAAALPAADVERRAWNRCEATIGVDDDVAADIALVGRRALDRSAHAVAATAFERAALLSGDDDRRAERFLAAGEAAWLAGQAPRALDLLDQAARHAGGPHHRAAVDGLRGGIALRAGSLATARGLLRGAGEQLAGEDPDAAAALLSDAVTACFFMADAATAMQAAAALDDVLARCTTDLARLRGDLTVGIARVLAGRGGADRIRTAVRSLAAMPGWADDRRRPEWMVLGTLFLRESETGRELVEHVARDLREDCALGALPNLLLHTARYDATGDRWDDAAAAYEEGIALARETGQTTDLAMCLAGLAWLQSRRGDRDACGTNAAAALDLAGRYDIHLARIWATAALGELQLAVGDPEGALAHLADLEALLIDIGVQDVDLSPGPEQAEALCRLGRPDEARAVARAYHARAVAKGQPWAMARAERAIALTTPGSAGSARFEAALALHRASPDVFEEGRTRLLHGAALRRDRQRAAARPQLHAALAVLDRLGARPWADFAAAELAATGERPHRRGEDELLRLTPQEQQIARLLGSGTTTREAAAALFLSPKTVEYHLRHVYTKLGISSRVELARVLEVG